MNSTQKTLLDLLERFGALCESEGIAYCVCDRTAWNAYWRYGLKDDGLDICCMVRSDAVDALAAAVGTMADGRYLLVRDGEGPQAPLRLVDTRSTFFWFNDMDQEAPGIALQIRPLVPTDDGYSFTTWGGAEVSLSTDMTATRTYRVFEHLLVPMPADCDEYFTATVGPHWTQSMYPDPVTRPTMNAFTSSTIGYEELLAAADELGILDDQRKAAIKDHFRANPRAKQLQADTADDTHRLMLNTQRLRLARKYLPYKQQLLDLWAAGAKKPVIKALEDDYLFYIRRQYGYGFGLYFDEELFNLAVEAMREQGWAHADELPAMVPPHHRQQDVAAFLKENSRKA